MKKILIAAAITTAISTTPAQAGVIFDFNYTDVGVGFNDATEGAARRGALESAGSYLSSFLTSYNATILLDVNGAEQGTKTLASASSSFNSAYPGIGFSDNGDVMSKILGGNSADPASSKADGSVNWNFNHLWELGNDFQAGEFDFFSTAVHEITHALGFSSGINENGSDAWGNSAGSAGVWTSFDTFLTDSNGVDIIDKTSFELDETVWNAAKSSQDVAGSTSCDKGLRFNGANAVAANGGESIELYAPQTWEAGSSGSHLDDHCYKGANFMEAASDTGLGKRDFTAIEIGMMRDIGYTQFGISTATPPTSVSEPATAFMMFSALLGLCGMSRRNKKT